MTGSHLVRASLGLIACAGLAVGSGAAAAAAGVKASARLETCPSSSLLRATLHESVHGLQSHTGALSTTLTPTFAPPAPGDRTTTSGRERTCIYLTRGAPIAISFVVPLGAASFDEARAAARKTSGIVVVRGLPASVWVAKTSGELFARHDTLGIVISAPQASSSALTALARRLLARL